MSFKIYHIPGVKIGCSINPKSRVRVQGYKHYEILEEHDDIHIASEREIELQIQYGYGKDNTAPYHQTVQMGFSKKGTTHNRGIPQQAIEASKSSHKERRKLTYEIAKEIRSKYKPRVYGIQKLANEYNVTYTAIYQIIKNITYKVL